MNRFIRVLVKTAVISFYCLVGFGCSWITRDYFYTPQENSKWECSYIPGSQESYKKEPIPDKAILSYENSIIKIKIYSGYTLTHTIGPCWFPIFPYIPRSSSYNILILNLIITTKEEPAFLTFSKFNFYINNDKNPSYYVLSDKIKGETINISENLSYKIMAYTEKNFNVKLIKHPKYVEKISFQIDDGIKINDKFINIPPLTLIKKAGNYNYDEWSL